MQTDMIEEIERRIRALESWTKAAERRFEKLHADLQENSGVTRSVKEDTQEIVALFKASKVNISIIKWLALAGGGIASVWATWRHLS
jgi:hypothetical protein